jgi:hypothetical protein
VGEKRATHALAAAYLATGRKLQQIFVFERSAHKKALLTVL